MLDATRKAELADLGHALLYVILGLRLAPDIVRGLGHEMAGNTEIKAHNLNKIARDLRDAADKIDKATIPSYASSLGQELRAMSAGLGRLCTLLDALRASSSRRLERTIVSSITNAETRAQTIAAEVGLMVDDKAQVEYGGGHLALLYLDDLASGLKK